MRFTPKSKKSKATAAVLALLVVGGVGGGAYAYWTNGGGSGTGTATAGSTAAPITVVQTSDVSNMGPGVGPITLMGTFTNNNTGPVYVNTVTASISSVTLAQGATGTCSAADFDLQNPAMTVGKEVAKGSNSGSWQGATIAFKDNPTVNQDGCKGATVNLSYAVA